MPTAQKLRERQSILAQFVRWLRLKKYQYEVTFSLYMLTPTERFIFSTSPPCFPVCVAATFSPRCMHSHLYVHVRSTDFALHTDFVLFVLVTLLIAAASMYLPNHIMTIWKRVWYYYQGEGGSVEEMAKNSAVAAGAHAAMHTRRMGEL